MSSLTVGFVVVIEGLIVALLCGVVEAETFTMTALVATFALTNGGTGGGIECGNVTESAAPLLVESILVVSVMGAVIKGAVMKVDIISK